LARDVRVTDPVPHRRSDGLRVLYVIDSLGHGGAEQSLVEMLPVLHEQGVRAAVVGLTERPTELVSRARTAGATVVHAPPGNMAAQVRWLRRLVARSRPDLVHTTLFRADLVGRLAAAGLAPVVTSLVNVQYGEERERESGIPTWKLWSVRQVERWSGRFFTARFHANSEAVATAAEGALAIARDRMVVIPRGRDPRRFSPQLRDHRRRVRDELGVGPDTPVVISVGRQEFQKGHRYLVETFAEVVAARPDAMLWLVGGKGAATSATVELIERWRLEDNVRLLGRRDDVPELLGAADIFALASLWEGLPNVVIEAQAVGLPVVASAIPPVIEAVDPDRTALLSEPATPHAMAIDLLALIRDPGRCERLGSAGRDHFLERFTIEPVVAAMAELYTEVAGA
jgi:glycosyltransferase involved in cell wall biosynthesis